ncbi:MAG: translation elongation factor Ts [Elusimicrobia bacterium]|nr:translation elongation factor Ts [Elusimicrobiota bacterium]
MSATAMEQDFNKVIMKLRETTGAGMMDCKKALTEAKGNYDEALVVLRKKGLSDAAKKAGRVTKEGVIAYAIAGPAAAIVELNSETDFVARNAEFVALGQTLADKFAKGQIKSVEDAKDLVAPVFQKLRENMGLRRFERIETKGGHLYGYAHKPDPNLGAKQGALIELSREAPELAKELLLQIVAAKPRYLNREDVPAAEIAKEREIHTEILKKEGKPEAQIPKIVEGKINKLFYQSLCLLEQPSVRDNKTPISGIVKEAGAKAGGPVAVTRFVRYQLGE